MQVDLIAQVYPKITAYRDNRWNQDNKLIQMPVKLKNKLWPEKVQS